MKTVPLSEAKAHLSRLVDEVEGRDEEVVITRNGRAAAVLVSPSDLESLEGTAAVRSVTALVGEIRRGLCALERGRAKLYTLDALLED